MKLEALYRLQADGDSDKRQALDEKISSKQDEIQKLRDKMPSSQNRTKVSPANRLMYQKQINRIEEDILKLRERKLSLRKK